MTRKHEKQNDLFGVKDAGPSISYKTGTLFVRNEATGEYRVATPKEVVKAAREAIDKLFVRGEQIQNPKAATELFIRKLAGLDSERFAVLFLDNSHRIIEYEEMFFGTINSSAVHPREVVKRCLELNAASVIFTHNHPSGQTSPSRADETITLRLKEALSHIDVKVLDHIIIGGNDSYSLAEAGII